MREKGASSFTGARLSLRAWRARLRAWQGSFRAWRRRRPFWGGVLLILAGLELVVIPLLSVLMHAVRVVIYVGIAGASGLVIGGLLVACGLLAWFHPVQRVFYAVAGGLLSLVSFPATNLGGYFAGMLLGVTGASLVFGWTRDSGRRNPRAGQDSGSRQDHREQPETSSGSGRVLAIPAVPLLLLLPLAAGQVSAGSGRAWTQAGQAWAQTGTRPGQAWIRPGQAPPAAAGCLLPLPPLPCPSPSPSPSVPGTGPSPGPGPSPGAVASPSPHRRTTPHGRRRRARAAPGLVAATVPATGTAGSALMEGLAYDGVATVPTATGSQKMLKFSMSALTLNGGVVLRVREGGYTRVTRTTSVKLTGSVTVYATEMCGDLLRARLVRLCFSPSHPPPLTLPVMRFTDVVARQPLTTADSVQATGVVIPGS